MTDDPTPAASDNVERLNTDRDLSPTLQAMLPMAAERFYQNLTTHVGADASGRVIGPEIQRDVDTHVGMLNPLPTGGLSMRIVPQRRPEGLPLDAPDPSLDGFLGSVVDGTVTRSEGVPAPPEDVRQSYAAARRRLNLPRVPGVLRIAIVGTEGAIVLDLPRPSPLDQDPDVRALDVPTSGATGGDA